MLSKFTDDRGCWNQPHCQLYAKTNCATNSNERFFKKSIQSLLYCLITHVRLTEFIEVVLLQSTHKFAFHWSYPSISVELIKSKFCIRFYVLSSISTLYRSLNKKIKHYVQGNQSSLKFNGKAIFYCDSLLLKSSKKL